MRVPPSVRTWPVNALPRGVRAYVVGLPLAVAALSLREVLTASVTVRDAVLAAVLLVMGALSVEATRRLGEPAGTAVKDLLSVWWVPMAVLLPPVFVLLAPVPLMALTQWRVRATLPHRRVFSAASIGLAYAAASVAFHLTYPDGTRPPAGTGLLRWAVTVAAVAGGAATLNTLLIALAVKAADPEATWRELLCRGENWRLDGVDVCLGVTVAVLVGFEPLLVAFTLPPILLLQRGLLHEQLRAIALLDAKTGLLNATAWEREAAGKLLSLRRRGLPASVLLIDIDHFKMVNDTYGHLVGDRVLRAVADAMAGGVRDGDVLGRFGGEEFVALLPAADAPETDRIAERLRDHIAVLAVPLDGGEAVHVTVSIGAAGSRFSALSVPDLLAAADRCMYQAKADGRNRVVYEAARGA